MDFFSEVDVEKKDLPKLKTITRKVDKQKLNGYQIFAFVTFCICVFLGIVFGNLFPACGATSSIYSGTCTNVEFNFSLMLFFWFISLLVCLFFYAIGNIIQLLTSINNKLSKK